ncbi:30S ribosomal protein S4 [Sediminispirochaeta smaragdinae]|uniref:Small ribosomal subunit protein uS4 n=1 Tax=Sediminispirochaeta smaragdinae (strain DSM 11293 / JCM 15392 / SEBR 4228) TaxID=573413 RepID=E1RCN3_SEDSS|nr:30S ribosomal protein S4 [Sediminispirochaeta smaragdinae]ADK80113.1 ribosomal protein S4 [Sediminispirochaeta smaragdinae DSM 11293]
MARYVGPQCRLCRAEKTKLFLKGERCHTGKCPIAKKKNPPGKGPRFRARKMSDYGIQLREKQKLRRMYGLLEKQFKLTFVEAERLRGKTGENLIILLERRLDNVVYRLRFANSRKQARQLVSHGHILVNGKRVTIPSYVVRQGDEIEIREASKKMVVIKDALKEYTKSGVMPWIMLDPDAMKGSLSAIPRRNDVTDLSDVNEQLIVELYSR